MEYLYYRVHKVCSAIAEENKKTSRSNRGIYFLGRGGGLWIIPKIQVGRRLSRVGQANGIFVDDVEYFLSSNDTGQSAKTRVVPIW